MLNSRKIQLTLLYVRQHLLVTFLIGLPTVIFQAKAEKFAAMFFWYKLVTSLGYTYLILTYRRPTMIFYQNFDLSTRLLSISLLVTDFTLWILISYAVHLGSR